MTGMGGAVFGYKELAPDSSCDVNLEKSMEGLQNKDYQNFQEQSRKEKRYNEIPHARTYPFVLYVTFWANLSML